MQSVTMPPLDRWHKVSERLPQDADIVMGWVTLGPDSFVAQLVFVGGKFRLAKGAVSCSHWLPITVDD